MIQLVNCDILDSGANLICHQVNCRGVMNSGLAKQIRDRYPQVYEEFMRDYRRYSHPEDKLGRISMVNVSSGNHTFHVCNMYGQDRYGTDRQYTDYVALNTCFSRVADLLLTLSRNYTVAIPFGIGCGLGGGNWNVVYAMIEDNFSEYKNKILICKR